MSKYYQLFSIKGNGNDELYLKFVIIPGVQLKSRSSVQEKLNILS